MIRLQGAPTLFFTKRISLKRIKFYPQPLKTATGIYFMVKGDSDGGLTKTIKFGGKDETIKPSDPTEGEITKTIYFGESGTGPGMVNYVSASGSHKLIRIDA